MLGNWTVTTGSTTRLYGILSGTARHSFLRRRTILLLRPACHDLERVSRQRSLQRLRLIPRCPHPNVALLVRRQDHRHRFGVDRLRHGVRRGGQEAIDQMRSGHRLGLGARPVPTCGRDVCLCPNSHTCDQKSIRLSPFELTGKIYSVPTPLLEAVIGWEAKWNVPC